MHGTKHSCRDQSVFTGSSTLMGSGGEASMPGWGHGQPWPTQVLKTIYHTDEHVQSIVAR